MAKSPKPPSGEKVFRGRRVVGTLVRAPDGRSAYLAFQNQRDVWRSGEKTISDAVRKGTATWAIDEETLVKMRAKGVQFAGVFVRDTGDIWLAAMPTFFDRTKAATKQGPRSMTYKHLPVTHFRRRYGHVKV